MTKYPCSPVRQAQQRGVAAVEFSLVAILMFMFIFGTMEISRAIFLWSTMTAVTNRAARAASMTGLDDTTGKATLRRDAMFLATDGGHLALTDDIGVANLAIDYLALDASTRVTALPLSNAENTAICLNNPAAANCVRFVRVRLCQAETNCTPMPYRPLTLLPGIDVFNINMPTFAAIAPVASLGMPPTTKP
jgi:hypothetical protein